MACLVMHRACKVCGEFHDFFLAEGELDTNQRYHYHCPVTGQEDYLWDVNAVQAAAAPPANGVEIRPTGQPSGRSGEGA